MPAVVQYALEPLAVELREVPVPEIGDDDVLLRGGRGVGLRLRRAPVLQHAFLAGERAGRARPRVRRHGRAGRARGAAASRKATASSARRPRRSAASACCAAPAATTCVPTRKGFGYGVNGAMAPYVRVPARCLHAIPDTLPFELACLAEPHAVAYNAMCVNSTIRPGDVVVVLGPGPIGLLCARMAALAGADPLIVGRAAGRRGRGSRPRRALGATHTVDAGDARRRGGRARPSIRSAPTRVRRVGRQRAAGRWRCGWCGRTARSRRSAGRRT